MSDSSTEEPRAAEPTDTEGPAGTYGCACPIHQDARACLFARYGSHNSGRTYECCECMCHKWADEDE